MNRIAFLIIPCLLLAPGFALSGQTYKVNVSKDYSGQIYIDDSGSGDGSWIKIFDKKTGKEVAEQTKIQNCDPSAIDSMILYDDFNFDGIKDLGLADGFDMKARPTYGIYLADKKGKFTYCKALSDSKPIKVKDDTEDRCLGVNTTVKRTWNGRQMVETSQVKLTFDVNKRSNFIFSFVVNKNGKRVVLYPSK